MQPNASNAQARWARQTVTGVIHWALIKSAAGRRAICSSDVLPVRRAPLLASARQKRNAGRFQPPAHHESIRKQRAEWDTSVFRLAVKLETNNVGAFSDNAVEHRSTTGCCAKNPGLLGRRPSTSRQRLMGVCAWSDAASRRRMTTHVTPPRSEMRAGVGHDDGTSPASWIAMACCTSPLQRPQLVRSHHHWQRERRPKSSNTRRDRHLTLRYTGPYRTASPQQALSPASELAGEASLGDQSKPVCGA